jgi:predicted GNAT family acetyltransferase
MKQESYSRYVKPEESEAFEKLRHHRFEVVENDTVVSVAEVNYYSRPRPFYQVTNLCTETEYQGKGYASAVMDQVERFLIESGKPGILVDASVYNHSDEQSYYESRGWKIFSEEGHRVFNLSENIDPKIFAGYYMRGVDVT